MFQPPLQRNDVASALTSSGVYCESLCAPCTRTERTDHAGYHPRPCRWQRLPRRAFSEGVCFFNRDDLGSLPLGRVDIDGDAVFANVQEYDTVPAEEKQLEAHRRYYDVQFVVSGEEVMQFAPLEGLAKVQPFDEDADFGLYCTPERPSSIVLRAGDVAVLAPEDAHKPGCALDAPCCVRKIVVKVLV